MNESDAILYVVDDDAAMRRSLAYLFDAGGWRVETFESARAFLDNYAGHVPGCLLLDVRMPLMSGLELQPLLQQRGIKLPVIFLSGHGDLPMAVQAMKAGASDFLEKPCKDQVLLDAVTRAVARSVREATQDAQARAAHSALDTLTAREREVAQAVASGKANKVIAMDMAISEKTVQVHRHNALAKLGVRSAAEVARLLMASGQLD
ncbi:DNA-binding response regulator [Janthinobacterium sp. BJB412]|jgi:two-component system response regulator FixJ|nr:DNA-binding response regulator [Janthinobacterium sp. BJB412]